MPKEPGSSLFAAANLIRAENTSKYNDIRNKRDKMKEWGKTGLLMAGALAVAGGFVLEAETGVFSDGAAWVGNQF